MYVSIEIDEGYEHLLPEVFSFITGECELREQAEAQWSHYTSNNGKFEQACLTVDFGPKPKMCRCEPVPG